MTQPARYKKPWTPEEKAVVIEHWPTGGYAACQPLLPGRDYNAIRGAADRLCAKRAGRKDYDPRPLTDFIAAAIRREYATGTPRLRELAKRIDRNVGWIKYHAGEMGLRRPASTEPEDSWTDPENVILDAAINAGLGVSQMQRRLRAAGYLRTLEGIRAQVWKAHGGFRREYYTANEVAALFGIDSHIPSRWIREGKLRATRGPGPSTEGLTDAFNQWHVAPNAISAFLREHVSLWDHRKMRKEVLIDFLLGKDKAVGPLDELRAARAG